MSFNPFHSEYLQTGTLTNSKDPDEMPHNVAFIRICTVCKDRNKFHHNLEISTCDHLKYKMGNPILIRSTFMGKSIRMKRVKECCFRLEKKFLSDYVNYVSVFK